MDYYEEDYDEEGVLKEGESIGNNESPELCESDY